ncbi:uncharacterized protein LOC116139506 [Pistacia vera]|uniref:uncharacterized protein LOC116139506 n=1 Tax=Pistacia vera TaxID=55513 RepID=UPI0012631B32|nr:uncharacterized protein LOC116139506 [Pistacia vera]
MTFIGIIKTSNAFTINRHSDPVVMGIVLSVQFIVFYSCFSLEPKNKETIKTASVFRLVCYTILVVSLSLRKVFRRPPDSLAFLVSEDVSVWSTLWRVVKGCHGFCLRCLYRSFFIGFAFFEAIPCLCYLLIGDRLSNPLMEDVGFYLFIFTQFVTFIGFIETLMSTIHSDAVVMWTLLSFQFVVLYLCFSLEPKNKQSIIIASVFRLVCYTTLVVLLSLKEKQLRKLDDLRVQIEKDQHTSFQIDSRRSPDDLASRASDVDRQILRHDQPQDIQGEDEDKDGKLPGNKRSLMLYLHYKYKNLALVVLFLILEAISFVLDSIGKGKLRFTVAAFLLALFVFIPTLWVYLKGRSTRLPDERPIANVELLVSGILLLTTILHLIFLQKGVYDKYNLSLLPLAFAVFRAFSVVFAFRKEHENGTHNAAEPPAENQVNQLHDGLGNIMETEG